MVTTAHERPVLVLHAFSTATAIAKQLSRWNGTVLLFPGLDMGPDLLPVTPRYGVSLLVDGLALVEPTGPGLLDLAQTSE